MIRLDAAGKFITILDGSRMSVTLILLLTLSSRFQADTMLCCAVSATFDTKFHWLALLDMTEMSQASISAFSRHRDAAAAAIDGMPAPSFATIESWPPSMSFIPRRWPDNVRVAGLHAPSKPPCRAYRAASVIGHIHDDACRRDDIASTLAASWTSQSKHNTTTFLQAWPRQPT